MHALYLTGVSILMKVWMHTRSSTSHKLTSASAPPEAKYLKSIYIRGTRKTENGHGEGVTLHTATA